MDQFHKRPVRERVRMLFRWVETADEIRREVELNSRDNDALLGLESWAWNKLKATVHANLKDEPLPTADDIPF